MMRAPKINYGACVLVILWTLGAGLFTQVASASSTIPWTDDFDGYTNAHPLLGPTTNGWTASTNTVVAQDTVEYTGSGLAASIPAGAELTNTFTKSTSKTNVWIDMRVKVVTSDVPPTFPARISGVFFFNAAGCPVVQTGSSTNWLTNSLTMYNTAVPKSNVTGGNWVRVTVFKDYTRKKWALFVDGTLIRDDFSFYNTSVDGLSGFSFENRSDLDEVWVSTDLPDEVSGSHTNLLGDIDGDGLADAWEIHHFGGVSLYAGGSDPDGDGRNNSSEFIADSNPTVADHSPQGIAYREDFDTATNGSIGVTWRGMAAEGAVEVVSSDYIDDSIGTGRALSISNGSVNLLISDPTATNVWCQIYAKVALYDDGASGPDVTTNDQVAFYVNTNRDLMAYSGSGWLKLLTNTIPTNSWVGFAAHLDYENEKWDLFVSTNGGYNVEMERANVDPMDFNTANTASSGKLTNWEFSVGTEMLVDAVSVSPAVSNTAAEHLYVRGYDRLASPGIATEIPPYDYSGTNRTLIAGGDMGEHAKRGLAIGDTLKAYTSNTWSMFYLDGLLEWQRQYGLTIENLEFTPSISMTVESSEDMTVFYTYATTPTNAVTETLVGVVNGDGWNNVTVDFDVERTLNDDTLGFDFDNADAGDRVYINGNRYIYNGDLGKWKARTGGVVTNESLGPGAAGFWYYRKDTSDMIWTLP